MLASSSEMGARLVPKPAAAKIGVLPSRPKGPRASFGSTSPMEC